MNDLNWHVGWCLLIVGLLSGAAIGLGFGNDQFWGGYDSWRRRLIRLGHIACVVLGAGNLMIHQIASQPAGDSVLFAGHVAFATGAIAMPSVCFLSGWQKKFRHLFFIPVSLLVGACLVLWWRAMP